MSRLTIPMLAGAALLSGCAAIPDMGPRPNLWAPETLKVAVAKPQTGSAALEIDKPWWTRYGDPQLDGLVAQALSQSPSLAEANARLRAAAARAGARCGHTATVCWFAWSWASEVVRLRPSVQLVLCKLSSIFCSSAFLR